MYYCGACKKRVLEANTTGLYAAPDHRYHKGEECVRGRKPKNPQDIIFFNFGEDLVPIETLVVYQRK